MAAYKTKETYLYLDIGNSQVDWLLGSKWQGKAKDFASLIAQIAQLPGKPTAVRMACARQQEQAKWHRLIAEKWQVQVQIARVKEGPIELAYKKPQQLGIDRWLGLLVLYKQNPQANWMMVDAGTALTIDFLVGRRHLGGFIVPGIGLMRQSCANLIDGELDTEEVNGKYGNSTSSCINHGSWNMTKNFIHQQWHDFVSIHPIAKLILTGGDGEALYGELLSAKQITKDNSRFEPLLACRGLAYAFDGADEADESD